MRCQRSFANPGRRSGIMYVRGTCRIQRKLSDPRLASGGTPFRMLYGRYVRA